MKNKTGSPKVSVVIPTFNRANFIKSAVGSIMSQDYDNVEIIIIDDGSTDSTERDVQAMQENNPKIVYAKNRRGKGASGARNTGLEMAGGEYIAFLDSDDIWLKGHLQKGISILEEHAEIDVYFANFRIVDYETGETRVNFFEKKNILHRLKSENLSSDIRVIKDNMFIALIQEGFYHLGGSIIRKPILDGIEFDETTRITEDRDFAIKLYKKSNALFAYNTNPVFILYEHESNLYNKQEDNRWLKIIESHDKLFSKYFKLYELTPDEKVILSKLLARLSINRAYLYGKNRDMKIALICFYRSLYFYFGYLKANYGL